MKLHFRIILIVCVFEMESTRCYPEGKRALFKAKFSESENESFHAERTMFAQTKIVEFTETFVY